MKGKRVTVVKEDTSESIMTESTENSQRKTITLETKKKSQNSKPKQDDITKEDLLNEIKGCDILRTLKEKKALLKMTLFKTWVKYYDNDKRKFRYGGILSKVEYPTYIMLKNPTTGAVWSVQLLNTILFINKENEERIRKKQQSIKEEEAKDTLFKLYKAGRLNVKK